MSFLNRVRNFFSKAVTVVSSPFVSNLYSSSQESSTTERPTPNKAFGGSRKTETLDEGSVYRYGKYTKLSESVFTRYSPKRLLSILKHNHPDVSQAIWNFKIIGNSGYTARVTKLDGRSEHESGQKLIDNFIRKLDFYSSDGFEKSRSLDRLIDQMFDSALVRGAISLEMVMDSEFTDVMFLANVDP
ncbi:hypothetical protein MOD02_21455, partial [Bacillus spizizenii]|nr:hypothetical protein [Bacillus spizizenii]